jgi:tetratricopeptide (TPR) repeat protein
MDGGVPLRLNQPVEAQRARWCAAGLASCMALTWPTHAAAAENGALESRAAFDAARPAATTEANADSGDPNARDEAARHFETARVLYAKGDYERAAIELERAHALVPDPRVLYKLGKLWLHLQRHAQARRAFEKYLEDSGAELSPDSRRQVEADLEQLREKTAELEVSVNVSGCEVFVDDVPFGHSPLSAALVLDAGERRLSLRKDGYVTHETRLTLAGNAVHRLDAILEPAPPEPTPVPPARSERPRPAAPSPRVQPSTTATPTLTWVAWSVTGALAAGAATAGVLGLVAASELDELKDDPNASRDALERQAGRAEFRLITADILAGATLLAAGSALYLTFSAEEKAPHGSAQSVSFRISPAAVTVAASF